MTETIKTFDNSMISTFLRCPRLYYYQYILRLWTPVGENVSFGAAMHEGLAAWYDKSAVPEIAIANSLPKDQFDSAAYGIDRASLLMDWYKTQPEYLKIKEVEIGFRIHLWEIELGGKTFTIFYGGKMDLIATHPQYEGYVVVDHKCTVNPKYYLGTLWMNRQMTGYIIATILSYGKCLTAMINAITVKDPFARQLMPMTRDEKNIDGWLADTKFWVNQMLDCEVKNFWPKSGSCELSWAQHHYKKAVEDDKSTMKTCMFVGLCLNCPQIPPKLEECSGFEQGEEWSPWNEGKVRKELEL